MDSLGVFRTTRQAPGQRSSFPGGGRGGRGRTPPSYVEEAAAGLQLQAAGGGVLGHCWLSQIAAPVLGGRRVAATVPELSVAANPTEIFSGSTWILKKVITPHSWGLSGRSWGLPALQMARLQAGAPRSPNKSFDCGSVGGFCRRGWHRHINPLPELFVFFLN